MITEPAHEELIAPVVDELGEVLVVGSSLEDALGAQPDTDPHAEAGLDMPWALIFTSGTSAAPKAVICSQRRILVTGSRMGQMMGLGPDDIGYVSMPLFHSNAVMVGWAPSVVFGASVGLARRFTASGWLADVRRYGGPTSTTRASRWPTSWPNRSGPTTRTTPCGWRTATRGHRRWSRRSPNASGPG